MPAFKNVLRERRVLALEARDHALDLPPLFRAVTLREAGDAFAHASAFAAELGAGTFVHVGTFNFAEFAVVLEPEEPLVASRRVFYAGMAALADALAGLAPPETPVAIVWPDGIHIDGGVVGGGRLGWPDGTAEHDVPRWLVFGAMIRLAFPRGIEPGCYPAATALGEEGFSAVASARLAESFARHFMVALDRWREGAFAIVARDYLARMNIEGGMHCGVEENGDLRIGDSAGIAERRSLRSALALASWLDPETGEPRL